MKQRNQVMHSENDSINSKNINPNDIQLHKMKTQEHFIEAQVQEGDTLQAIALRFRCSISELKRINKIHKDNEIFARRTIKVPVTPYSVLTELVPDQGNETSSRNTTGNSSTLPIDIINSTQNDITLNKGKDYEHTIDCNSIVMNSTLAPSVVPYMDSEPYECVSEDTKLLPSKVTSPVEAVVVKQLTSQGADLGLKWFHLFCCVLLLGVVIPVMYILFHLDKEKHSQALHKT